MGVPEKQPKHLTWPSKKTAILIIHGIGQQETFETLDSFTRHFWEVLSRSLPPDARIEGHHKQLNWGDWVENYVSLVKNGEEATSMDFYEYYWAYKMERQITLAEISEWLLRTSDGARKYYADNLQKSLRQERQDVNVFTKDGGFKKRGYLKRIGWYARILLFTAKLLPEGGYVSRILYALFGKARRVIIDYIGDIAIYTSTDMKSRHYEIRQAVLHGAVQKITKLLEDGYGQIIVVGHSLGSVVAYDALNRLNRDMNVKNVDKNLASQVVGLVTFGSPLDKIAFFFRERVEKDHYIRRQILEHFHGFKSKKLAVRYPQTLSNPIVGFLNHIHWVNYWNNNDPVSGHLDFYDIPDEHNIHLDLSAPWGIAHVKYWEHPKMYQDIAERFLN